MHQKDSLFSPSAHQAATKSAFILKVSNSSNKLMTQEQLKTFLEKAKSNHSLQEKLKAAADSDAVVAIAKEADFLISADELSVQSEISEVELESVAGGFYFTIHMSVCGGFCD